MLHTVVTMNGEREEELIAATRMLMDARRTLVPMGELPEKVRPVSEQEAYFVQEKLALVYGDIGGWKVGAATPESEPRCGPMPLAWMGSSGAVIPQSRCRLRGMEAEIAFLLGRDLPRRETPYMRDEVVDAIASCHPAIELLESSFADPMTADPLAKLGDLQTHGGFVHGEAYADWKSVDFSRETVVLDAEGVLRVERTGSNTAGDLMRLLPWLANEGAARTGGLKAGQWVTTGSWTGVSWGLANSAAQVRFAHVGEVHLRFE